MYPSYVPSAPHPCLHPALAPCSQGMQGSRLCLRGSLGKMLLFFYLLLYLKRSFHSDAGSHLPQGLGWDHTV